MNIGGIFLALQGAVSQGILWGVLVLGVYITYKILDIADLTVDGSFALGGCICATFVVGYGMNPFLALIISTLNDRRSRYRIFTYGFRNSCDFIGNSYPDCPLVHQSAYHGKK